MTLKVYEHVLAMNQGFDQVLRSLKALAKYPSLQPDESPPLRATRSRSSCCRQLPRSGCVGKD